jgi:hypothetical protein
MSSPLLCVFGFLLDIFHILCLTHRAVLHSWNNYSHFICKETGSEKLSDLLRVTEVQQIQRQAFQISKDCFLYSTKIVSKRRCAP